MDDQQERPPVVVHPDLDGTRRVTVHGESVGKATSLGDVAEFLRRTGLEDADVQDPALVEWRGGDWTAWD